MRSLIAVVVLLLTALAGPALSALAADPPGGPGWYQLADDAILNVTTPSGKLVITAGTPGFLVGATATTLTIRFERGIATWLGKEITADSSPATAATLTVPNVDPTAVRAFVRQPLSKVTPAPGGTSAGGSSSASGGGALAGLGGGQSITSASLTRTTVTIEDVEE